MELPTIAGWVCFETGGNLLMASRDEWAIACEMRATCEGNFDDLYVGWIHEESEFATLLAAFNAPGRRRAVVLDDVLGETTLVRDVEPFTAHF